MDAKKRGRKKGYMSPRIQLVRDTLSTYRPLGKSNGWITRHLNAIDSKIDRNCVHHVASAMVKEGILERRVLGGETQKPKMRARNIRILNFIRQGEKAVDVAAAEGVSLVTVRELCRVHRVKTGSIENYEPFDDSLLAKV